MARKRGRREAGRIQHHTTSSRFAVLAWPEGDPAAQGACGLPEDAVEKLSQSWLDEKELVDGSTILSVDAEPLALAPITQPYREENESGEQQEQEDKQQEQGQQRRGRCKPARHAPATQLTQAPQQTAAQAARQDAGDPQYNGGMQSTQVTQPSQLAFIKPDPEEVEAEARVWQEQQEQEQPRRTRRRLSEQHYKQEPLDEDGDAAMEGAQQEQEEEEGYEYQPHEEEEEHQEEGEEATEDEDAPRRRRFRVKSEPRDRGAGDAAAVQEHSLPLMGRRSTRTGGPQQEQQQEEQKEAGPSCSRHMITRWRQHEEQDRAERRALRARTMQERQRRDEADEAARSDEEEEEAGGEQQQQAAEEDEECGPLVTEDLGPEASSEQFVKDWKRRAKWGIVDIFMSMSVEQLRELVEEQDDWPETSRNILRRKRKVDGESSWVDYEKARQIAPRLANFILTGDVEGREDQEGGGGMRKQDIRALLMSHCDDQVKAYVEDVLKLRYQNLPRMADPHKLMWHLWHYPTGPANRVVEALLGSRELEYEAIVCAANLEPNTETGLVPWRRVWDALCDGRLTIANHAEVDVWLTHVNDLSAHPRAKVVARLTRQPGNKKLRIYIYQIFTAKDLSSSVITGTWTRKSPETNAEELLAVDLHYVLGGLDSFEDSPFMEAMDRLSNEYSETETEVAARGVAHELELDTPMNLKQFDKVMACIEDIDRGEPEGFKDECNDSFLLTLRPYQRRSLAHMLREERAQGGSSRHLWVKLNLPENPELHSYVSPILHQIRSSTSKIEAEQWVHANGGAGWIALQMGMGKTACAVGAIQLNPPPKDWCKNRMYQRLRARDHLSSIANNMPHGDTLIVMPPTLIDQWEQEIRKTIDNELTVLKWTENMKSHPRTMDCKDIAKYNIVLTTFQNASTLHTLSHIYWWRIIADEPQLNAGGFLGDDNHPWFAQHRWLLTGTPVNATVDSMGNSLQFLKLGSYDTLYKHYPPVIAHVLKCFMVRYTKMGMLDGETNLQLPEIVQHLVECDLTPVDKDWYRSLQVDLRNSFASLLAKHQVDPNCVGAEDPNWEYGRGTKVQKQMMKMRSMVTKLRQAASSALKQPTGEQKYVLARGEWRDEKHWYQSKAEAVIEVLQDKDPEEKVLIFSEFPDTLRAIKARLPGIGLQSRDIIGSSSTASRGKSIRLFQTDPPTKVFLLTYRAGGAGITLTAGTHIVLCEPSLNPSFERQAIGRSHRMGQDKALTITRLLMRGTIEEQVREFVQRQTEHEQEDPEEALESTAMEANLAARDGSNKLTIEELRDFIYRGIDEEDD